jgi:hypothetical protein
MKTINFGDLALLDMTAPQTQLSTEPVCPVRQTLLVDAHQRRGVVHHGCHPQLHERTAITFADVNFGGFNQ